MTSKREVDEEIAKFVRDLATVTDTRAGRAVVDSDPRGFIEVMIAQARELAQKLPQ